MEHADLTGAILDGRYRVIAPIAQGAMGTVYRAERVKLGRIVAIKVLHDVLPHELSGRKRFEIEAMAMAKLEHPHCASVLDVGVFNDRPYVVMDFVSGQNLKDLIATGPQPIARAIEIVRQILTGLAHAHEHGIIHRDIKPANLVLSQKTGLGDHVKILDFGLARLHDAGQNLTTGIVVGTPAYMAPEQIRGLQLDARCDLYACGVLLFELLTATKPFHSEADDPIEVCRMHLSAPIPRLDDKLPGVDFGELEAVVAKALAKDRDGRYASAQEFAAALDGAAARRPSRQGFPPTPPSGPLELGARDMLAAPDASYPPAVEVRTADVIAAIPDPSQAASEDAGLDPDLQAYAPTPLSGPRTATPPAGSRTATPPAGWRAATPPAGTRAASSPAPSPDDDTSEPGMFLGLSIRASTQVPRDGGAGAGSQDAGASDVARADRAAEGARGARGAPGPRWARWVRWPRSAVIAGVVLFAVVGAAVVVSTRGGPSEPTATRPSTASGSAAVTDPIREVIARASELAAQGERDAAIEMLHRSRRQYPDSALLAYTAGRLCFSKFYWTEGLRNFRDAIRNDPAYRSDPELIKAVLRGFITTPGYNEDLAGFLHDDIGSAAQPFLEETARDHPNPWIRSRAASELRRYH